SVLCPFSTTSSPRTLHTLYLHDALPIFPNQMENNRENVAQVNNLTPDLLNDKLEEARKLLLAAREKRTYPHVDKFFFHEQLRAVDRKSTRLNSSHVSISYAVFCLKKKKK